MTAISIPIDSCDHPFSQCTKKIAFVITINRGIVIHLTKRPIKSNHAPPASVAITNQLKISGKGSHNDPNHFENSSKLLNLSVPATQKTEKRYSLMTVKPMKSRFFKFSSNLCRLINIFIRLTFLHYYTSY